MSPISSIDVLVACAHCTLLLSILRFLTKNCATGEFAAFVICYASCEWNGIGPDGNPNLTKRFTQLVLPTLEMPDKEGKTLEERASFLIKSVLELDYKNFFHMWTDGGVENTGNSRAEGLGEKGLFARAFHPEGCTWTWCCKHRLSLAFNDSDLSLVHEALNQVSRFLKVANRWNKLKPHLELILRHTRPSPDDEDATIYHKQSGDRLKDLSPEVLGQQEDALSKVGNNQWPLNPLF